MGGNLRRHGDKRFCKRYYGDGMILKLVLRPQKSNDYTLHKIILIKSKAGNRVQLGPTTIQRGVGG